MALIDWSCILDIKSNAQSDGTKNSFWGLEICIYTRPIKLVPNLRKDKANKTSASLNNCSLPVKELIIIYQNIGEGFGLSLK